MQCYLNHSQLKAFYVDLLVPLETNLEKDTKVVQFEQKKFLQQHKIRADSYSKATATMKKQRKKKSNAQNTEKEMKVRIDISIAHKLTPSHFLLTTHFIAVNSSRGRGEKQT